MSRLKFARGATKPAAGAAPKAAKAASPKGAAARPAAVARPGVFVQKPKSDIYVALLGIALGAILLGCLLLVLKLGDYEFKTKAAAIGRPAPATALV